MWLLFLYLFFSSIHHVHLLLSSTSNFMTEYFPYMIRSANVLEGAHVQWEIELLGFEIPKVIYKISSFLFFLFFFFWGGGGGLKKWDIFLKKKKCTWFKICLKWLSLLHIFWDGCGTVEVLLLTTRLVFTYGCELVEWSFGYPKYESIWFYFLLPQKVVQIRGRTKTKQAREYYNQYGW